VLTLTQLACRPIVTVGWWELVIFLVIALIVVLPLVIRLFRWLSGWRAPRDTSGRRRDRRE
jgi:hypothetical protein